MSEAIAKRLPADSLIGLSDKDGKVQIAISMTMTEPGHTRALMEAIQVALLPLLELRQAPKPDPVAELPSPNPKGEP